VKATCWPVALSSQTLVQRRYPWGDTMDHNRANLWGTGPNRAVAVHEFPDGVSVGGVYQLIGNVWEWTGGNFRGDQSDGELVLPVPMKSIRGGAFDTYFDHQATGQFQSGDNPLQRRHNIGFRCAIGVCDLLLARSAPARDVPISASPAAVLQEASA
jgi:iron(II)-dependent oxidoreductase